MLFAIGIALIVIVDQVSKYAVRSSMQVGESIPVVDGFFNITYYRNNGAAFSSMEGHRAILIGFSSIAVIAALFFLVKYRGRSKVLDWSLVLIIAGGIGNLIDRIMTGEVTDMLDFSIFPPIFNVADIAVTVGCLLMVVFILFTDTEALK